MIACSGIIFPILLKCSKSLQVCYGKSENFGFDMFILKDGYTRKKPDKDIIYTLRCAHQKQAQLILLADQKAQILSDLFLVMLSLLGNRLIYINTDYFLNP